MAQRRQAGDKNRGIRGCCAVSAAIILLTLGGCAAQPRSYADPVSDPIEPFNRGMYSFNRGLDRVTLKPLAKGYSHLPFFVRSAIGNFFSNIEEPVNAINALLQGKPRAAASDLGRLLINSTLGVGGLMDPATSAGLVAHEEDFGQTLAVWGVPSGAYLIIPLMGPGSVRDILGGLIDAPFLLYWVEERSVRDKLIGLSVIDSRAGFLGLDSTLDEALDPYVLLRESWTQRRNFVIWDGEPPLEPFPDEEEWGDDDDWDIKLPSGASKP